ncbi:MAG: FecR family protein [Thermoanaerobaculaceae bacterium]|nr:FecR family protein [Thermoanaerobaculaceae bacterium]
MRRSGSAITAIFAGLLVAAVAYAGDDMTSLSYISYLERYATLQPGHGGESLDVVVNMPVLAGDRLDSSRGARVEVQLADGSTVWVDEFSTLDFDAIALSRDDASSRSALYLAEGAAAVEIPATASGSGPMRFDTPNGTVYLNRPGLYRIELNGTQIRVQTYSGMAELPVGVGSAMLRTGEEAVVGQQGEIQKAAISDRSDDFWNWVQERRNVPMGRTAQYVDSRDASRAGVLDAYGDWVYVPTFSSWMWQPRVNAGWVPYSDGRWYWTPVGWSWISYEPWGWYPFHYGSWYFDASFGWVWGWDSVWGPSWVDWIYTPGYIGWCPRGYYDWWYYHNYRGAWGGPGGRRPGRWSDVSFDFSGRVRMGAIDPRPWTFVPTGQFSSLHIDRVRIEPNRFLRDNGGNLEGFVRSGPLVTATPGRALGDRTIDSFFRAGTGVRGVPDLSEVLRRERVDGARTATPFPALRPTNTTDVMAGSRGIVTRVPGAGARGTIGTDRWIGRDTGRGGTIDPTGRTFNPDVVRGRTGIQGTNPPAVRREIVRREDFTRQGGQPNVVRTAPPPTVERISAPRPVERVSPPPQPRPRNDSVSWVRERNVNRWEGSPGAPVRTWSAAGSRAAAPAVPRTARSWAPVRTEVRSFAAPRSFEPRAPVREFAAERGGASGFRGAPMHFEAPRPAPRGNVGRPRR